MGTLMSFIVLMTCFILSWTFSSLILNSSRGCDLSNKGGIPVAFTISFGFFALQIICPFDVFFDGFVFGFYPIIMCLMAVALLPIIRPKMHRSWILFVLCFMSTLLISPNQLIFGGLFPLLLDRLVAGVLWTLFIYLYSKTNKIDEFINVQSLALLFAFAFASTFLSLPGLFGFSALIAILSMLGFLYYRRKMPFVYLGKSGAMMFGYLIGFFFIYLMINGFYWVFLTAPIYVYFENLYYVISRYLNRKKKIETMFNFYTTSRQQVFIARPNYVQKTLFFHLLLIALVALMFSPSLSGVLILNILLMIGLIYRLSLIGARKIRYRDILSDVKQGCSLLFTSVKENVYKIRKK